MLIWALLMLCAADQCLKFECGDITVADQTKCGQLDGDTYHLRQCPRGYHCESDKFYDPQKAADAYCVPDEQDDSKWNLAPGDLCFDGDRCYGDGKCVDGVCVPLDGAEGSSCSGYRSETRGWISSNNKQCQVGNYCDFRTEICLKAEEEIGAKCKIGTCANGWGCNNGKCARRYSLPDGTNLEQLN